MNTEIINLVNGREVLTGLYRPGSTVIVMCDCTNGNIDVTLPDAKTVNSNEFMFVKTDASVNTVTINTVFSQKISGDASVVLSTQWQCEKISCDRLNYIRENSGTDDHTALTNLNSTDYTHLTAANATDLTDGNATTLHKHDHGAMDGLTDNDHTQYVNAVSDSDSIDLTLTGQSIGGAVLPAGVDHSALANLNTTDYTHLTAANHTDLTDGGFTTLHQHASNSVGICFKVFSATTSVGVSNGVSAFAVPALINGWNLSDVTASVYEKGVTGTTDIQVRRRRAGLDVDMLSTKVTIGDEYFADDEVIDTSKDDLMTGDNIYIDVTAVHTTAPKGLSVALTFEKQ